MHARQRRAAGVVVAAVGVAFIVVVIVNQLFTVGPAFERMSDAFRPAMNPAPVAQLQNDLTGLEAVSEEFGTKAVPLLAESMGMTPEQFTQLVAQEYPAVAVGAAELPAIVTQFRGVVGTLQAEQERFDRADAIPSSNLPATSVPWGLLAVGVILLAAGIYVAVRPGGIAPALAGVLGAALIAVPVALSLPQKASAADTMNEHLKPVYTAQMLTQAKGALATVGAMGEQMQTEMLPALGQQLGMSQAELQAFLGRELPAIAAGIQSMPQTMGRFQQLVTTFDSSLADYDAIKSVTFVPIVWALIVGGIVTLLAAWMVPWQEQAEPAEEVRPFQKAA